MRKFSPRAEIGVSVVNIMGLLIKSIYNIEGCISKYCSR